MLNNRRIFKQAKTGEIVAIRQVKELEARLKAAVARRAAARAKALLAAKTAERHEEIEELFTHAILDERNWKPFNASHYSHTFGEVRQVAVDGVKNEDGSWKLEPVKSLADFWDMDLRDTSVVWMALAGSTVPEIISVTGHTIESATRILKHYLARHPEMADHAIGKMLAWYDAGGETEIGFQAPRNDSCPPSPELAGGANHKKERKPHMIEKATDEIDLEAGEISGLVEALRFIAEEEGEQAERLPAARVSILCVISDKLDSVSKAVAHLRFWRSTASE